MLVPEISVLYKNRIRTPKCLYDVIYCYCSIFTTIIWFPSSRDANYVRGPCSIIKPYFRLLKHAWISVVGTERYSNEKIKRNSGPRISWFLFKVGWHTDGLAMLPMCYIAGKSFKTSALYLCPKYVFVVIRVRIRTRIRIWRFRKRYVASCISLVIVSI